MTEAKRKAEIIAKAAKEFSNQYDALKNRGYAAKKILAREIAEKYGLNREYFERLMVSRDSNLW